MGKLLRHVLVRSVIAFSLAASLAMPALPAMAATSKQQVQSNISQLQQQKAELERRLTELQANREDTESYISDLDAELMKVYAEIDRLSGELEIVHQKLDQTMADLEQTRADLEVTRAELVVAKEKEAEQYAALRARIKSMYESGDTTLLEIFMRAEDMSMILNADEYIARISDYDNQLLSDLLDTRREIEQIENKQMAQEALLEAQEARLESQMAELEDLLAAQQTAQEELELIMQAKQEELAQINGDIDSAYYAMLDTEAELQTNRQILANIQYQEELARQRAAAIAAQQAAIAAQQAAAQQAAAQQAAAQQAAAQQAAEAPAEQAAAEAAAPAPEAAPAAEVPAEQPAAEAAAPAPEAAPAAEVPAEQPAAEAAAPAPEAAVATEAEHDHDDHDHNYGDDATIQQAIAATTQTPAYIDYSAVSSTGTYVDPLGGMGYTSSGYGGRTAPTEGASTNHKGVDIAAAEGTPIVAADGGVISSVSYSPARGNYVVVTHENGVSTLYQHCSAVNVEVGQTVDQGENIAAVGSTGISTGAHLHYEVLINGENVDPSSYLGR